MSKRKIYRLSGDPEFDNKGRRIRLRHDPSLKDRLSEAQNHRCGLCGGDLYKPPEGSDIPSTAWGVFGPSFEHIIPFSEGGADDWSNLALTHLCCNLARHPQPTKKAP